MKKILKIFGTVILALIAAVIIMGFINSRKPVVEKNYQEKTQTGGEIEAYYLKDGPYETACREYKAEDPLKKIGIRYPKEMETSEKRYPVIVYGNGSGVKGSTVKYLLDHYASWGFIVIDSENTGTWSSASADQTLTFLLKENENMDANLRKKIGLYNPLIYGWYLGQYITKALARLEELPCDGIYAQRVYFEQPVNHDDEHLYDVACKVRQIFAGDDPDARGKATAYGKEHGISTVFHAGAIRARRNRPQTQKMELNAVRIGQLAFVTFPYETFGATGMYVKENSPVPMTLVFSVANEHWSYTPTREAYDFGCYESSISYFAKGTAEACAEKLVDMLHSLQ